MALHANPVAAACGGVSPVGDETALDTAIAAFNAETTSPCVFTIQLNADIDLTASTTRIDNATSGVGLVIEGNGHALDGQDVSGVLPIYVQPDTTVTLNNITITRGNSGHNGGGVFNRGDLTINNSTISDNLGPGEGGGIANAGTLVVNDSTITGNSVTGAIAFGGGIASGDMFDGSSLHPGNGTITINRSAITNNSAGSQGSAIAVESDMTSLTINNSTISGNTVVSDLGRAAIINWGSTLIINSSTIADNAGGTVSGIFTFNDTFTTPDSPGVTTVQNSIILQDGTTPACGTVLGGSIVSAGHNLVGDSSCGFTAPGDQQNTDPLLGPLADNGGATFTHALLDNSPAIDAGDTSLTTDQRGVARPQGAADDIGAYEDAGLPPVANNDVYAMPQDTVLTVAAPGILSNDSDPEGHALTVTVTGPPSHGHLAPHPDGSFSYTPDAGYSGTDTFTYKANDGHHDSNEATVTIDVHASNRAPVAHDDAYSVGQGGLLKIDAKKGLLSNDTDADGNQLTVLVQSQPANGVLNQQRMAASLTSLPAISTGLTATPIWPAMVMRTATWPR